MNEWLADISDDDIAVLMEALEAWEHKDFAGEIISDLFCAVLPKGDPASKEKDERRAAEDRLKRERARSVRKERSLLLRAKLLTIRQRRGVEDVAKHTSQVTR